MLESRDDRGHLVGYAVIGLGRVGNRRAWVRSAGVNMDKGVEDLCTVD